ncbi:MAG: thiamine pyrophosphate-dependent dehydrogenase E1 component subunit alpha [Proteobacteria bacterium]|nr:thiamine pyrophosphate-dependent dehydrogenase E1 component subunit alpha [Pseudomonadota bacterium]
MKLEKEDLLKLYRNLARARVLDQLAIKMLSEGKFMGFYHSAFGGEAPGVGGTTFLRQDDYIYPHHRGHGIPHACGKGGDLQPFFAEHCGKATGTTKGMTGFHGCDPEHGMYGGGGTIGSAFPLSVGWALAAKKNGRGQVSVCFFGDGSMGRGTFHEAMNMAANWKLPVVWVCENNGMGQYVPIKDAYPLDDIANMASAYGIPGVVVDGQDVVAVAEAVVAAVERAREGKGPSLIECKCLRFRSHAEGIPDWYHAEKRSEEEVKELMKRCPVALYRNRLLEQGLLTQEDAERIDRELAEEAAEIERQCDEAPFPDPSVLENAVYA